MKKNRSYLFTFFLFFSQIVLLEAAQGVEVIPVGTAVFQMKYDHTERESCLAEYSQDICHMVHPGTITGYFGDGTYTLNISSFEVPHSSLFIGAEKIAETLFKNSPFEMYEQVIVDRWGDGDNLWAGTLVGINSTSEYVFEFTTSKGEKFYRFFSKDFVSITEGCDAHGKFCVGQKVVYRLKENDNGERKIEYGTVVGVKLEANTASRKPSEYLAIKKQKKSWEQFSFTQLVHVSDIGHTKDF